MRQVEIEIPNKEALLADFKTILDTGWMSEGPFTQKYLGAAKRYVPGKELFAVPNGTLGLHLVAAAMKANGLRGTVLVPSFTFYGSATPFVSNDFKVKFTDSSVVSCQAGLADFEAAWDDSVVAIVLVHIYGQISAEVDATVAWARANNLLVIEDCAQALGVRLDSRQAGSFGDLSVYSTFSDKALATGEGGLVSVQAEEYVDSIRYVRNQGRLHSGTFHHDRFGMNYRITEFQAAVGAHLIGYYGEEILRRQRLYEIYEQCAKAAGIGSMHVHDKDGFVPFRFPIMVPDVAAAERSLSDIGYQTRRFFYPVHLQNIFREQLAEHGHITNAVRLADTGLCLPVHGKIGEAQVVEQIDAISGI